VRLIFDVSIEAKIANTLPERMEALPPVNYPIFTRSYSAAPGNTLIHGKLCEEAICLGRKLVARLSSNPEALGLVLLRDSCRETRPDAK
jgi:RNA polymerase sigma-70 factor (ECF subfamily)